MFYKIHINSLDFMKVSVSPSHSFLHTVRMIIDIGIQDT